MNMQGENPMHELAGKEEGDTTFAPCAEDAAQLSDGMADEEQDYVSANVLTTYDFEDPPDCQPSEYRDPDLVDPDEETLPPGEMEQIFENCFIM